MMGSIVETSNPDGNPVIPVEGQPWAWIAVANMLGNNVTGPIRQMSDQQLRYIAASIGLFHTIVPHYLTQWNISQLDGPGFWVGTVLPAIKTELERRQRPRRIYGPNSPIAKLKRLDIADVAARFTSLEGRGNRLKGRCPLHQERTASFYVYVDTQRWRCYGSCAEGGDIIDLMRRLGDQGKLQ